ncbi:hypothetical protein CDL12_24238 [Handroanthus impetiginosus]|uniref:TF-B3 domain-containing protein n=1 Tax=Handroanthus impetiginosus TaxID=429701 RepID=A0A2G9GD82_9LAMI|nr:hypothetical protein CDL12_24238 [Handroanthus impetiginosus]
MNFMSGRSGFYEEPSGTPARPISSSSSSLHHRPLPLYNAGAPPPDSSPTNNGNAGDDDSDDHTLIRRGGNEGSTAIIEKEHMFDKVVTPSDVGKLNRLVIPKQHAEKYFPLDSSTNEKGLLLNFEDRNGKPWRFRYSYWNSSQSYVMTKGWSRFVKEKKLDAGDIVSFQRGIGELGKERLFIDWRRRPDAPELLPQPLSTPQQFSFHRWNNYNYNNNHSPFLLQPPTSRDYYYNYSNIAYGNPCPVTYFRSAAGGGGRGGAGGVFGRPPQVGLVHARIRESGVEEMVYESVPVVQGKTAPPKRLRLFGVTMDCPISDVSDECDIMSTTTTLPLINHFDSSSSSSSIANSHQLTYNHPHHNNDDYAEKGKGTSMSLDLDI